MAKHHSVDGCRESEIYEQIKSGAPVALKLTGWRRVGRGFVDWAVAAVVLIEQHPARMQGGWGCHERSLAKAIALAT